MPTPFDMFRIFSPKQAPQPQVAAPAPAPAPTNDPRRNNPAASQTAQTSGTDANGVVPPGGADPGANPPSPLDQYKDLWQPPAVDPNAAAAAAQQVDPQKLMEAARKVDFSSALNQETLAKVAAGGDEAIKALLESFNSFGQQVYGQSAVTTARIVEQAVSQARDQFISEIPNVINRQGARAKVFDDNPAFKHPAIAPMIEAQVQQLSMKFPKASPAELTSMAKDHLQAMAALIAPPKADASAQGKTSEKDVDWDLYMSSDIRG